MDPFSITAGVVGITAPVLQCVQHLRNNIQAIIDAPTEITSLGEELQVIEQGIAAIQKVSDAQWKSLGDGVVTQFKNGMKHCKRCCSKFQATIDHWTRRGKDGKFSLRDRTVIGLFRQNQIKSTASQLQNCKATLISIVSIATLHSSLQQSWKAEEISKMLSTKEGEISTAISTTEKQLVEADTRFGQLQLASAEGGDEDTDDEEDFEFVTSQTTIEKLALQQSLELLKQLSENIRAITEEKQGKNSTVNNISFGGHNQGVQTGFNHGDINFSIGRGTSS